jgi:hypothetical protein
MIESVSFRHEFESEAEISIAQQEAGGRLGLFLTPFRQFLQHPKHSHLLAFSLARHNGASASAAFFLEWAYLSFELPKDYSLLYTINRAFLQSQVAENLRIVPSVAESIDEDAANTLITEQMKFVYQRFVELRFDLLARQPFLSRFFDTSLYAKVSAAELALRRPLYVDLSSTQDILDCLTYSSSFLSITLPCLVGFATIFSKEGSSINPEKIKWQDVESICKSISVLYQLRNSPYVAPFLRGQSYTGEQRTLWMALSLQEQQDIAKKDEGVQAQIADIANHIQERAMAELVKLVFPLQHKETLSQLIDWAYGAEPTAEEIVATA